MEFLLPFRITIPEMDGAVCKVADVCSGKYLRASFTMSMEMNLYRGLKIDTGRIMGLAMSLLRGSSSGGMQGPRDEQKVLGPIPIIKKMSLGCVELKGVLKIINDQFKGCCAGGGDGGYSDYEGGGYSYEGGGGNNHYGDHKMETYGNGGNSTQLGGL